MDRLVLSVEGSRWVRQGSGGGQRHFLSAASHPTCGRSVTTSSSTGDTTSVMSEMIGPEGGESGEKRADWRRAEQSNQSAFSSRATNQLSATVMEVHPSYLQGERPAVLGHGVGGAGVVEHQRAVGRGKGRG